ncbi:HAD hydrolase family protein [Fodinibius halophilus]|uniref:HAD hydrolase family protein n=1 Tax=Fodinibius halophilus TaxID=1736908 RepID=A0A6M1TC33_9BACT|nr:HAD hydrolase family protein [Fodinibius halophilus]NGP87792.1 HAD hydrolase family protein [Fodinibius halophilus]
MIKLFISDIDGCISEPFTTPDWDLLAQVRRLNEQSRQDMAVPPLTLCSGRPMPYVEAVAQWLHVDLPCVFESGGVYELENNRVEFLSSFDEEAEKQIRDLKNWLDQEIIPQYPDMVIEFTKKMDAGIIHLDTEIIDELCPLFEEYVEEHYPRFEVHKTEISINIILKNNNKGAGITRLCELIDVKPEEVAYIGDSSGDIPGLGVVGHGFAPQNAADIVKDKAEVLDASVTDAVLMAYRRIIQHNRKILAEV